MASSGAWPSAPTARPSPPDTAPNPTAAAAGWCCGTRPRANAAAACSAQGTGGGGGVVLWDVAARQRVGDQPLAVNEGDVEIVAFSPDGKTIAAESSGGHGDGVALWDVDLESWQRRAGRIANRNFT